MAPTGDFPPSLRHTSQQSGSHHFPKESRHKMALLIGINYPPKSCDDLSLSTHTDVHMWREALIGRYGWEERDIVCLTDEPRNQTSGRWPHYSNILAHLKGLLENARAGDTRVLLLAGHSVPSHPSKEETSILTSEFDQTSQVLAGNTIKTMIDDNLPTGTSLLAILDICYAAGILNLQRRIIVRNDEVAELSPAPGWIISVNACGALESETMVQFGPEASQKAGLLSMLMLHHLGKPETRRPFDVQALTKQLEGAARRQKVAQTPSITYAGERPPSHFDL